jgi:hypothetical protein
MGFNSVFKGLRQFCGRLSDDLVGGVCAPVFLILYPPSNNVSVDAGVSVCTLKSCLNHQIKQRTRCTLSCKIFYCLNAAQHFSGNILPIIRSAFELQPQPPVSVLNRMAAIVLCSFCLMFLYAYLSLACLLRTDEFMVCGFVHLQIFFFNEKFCHSTSPKRRVLARYFVIMKFDRVAGAVNVIVIPVLNNRWDLLSPTAHCNSPRLLFVILR